MTTSREDHSQNWDPRLLEAMKVVKAYKPLSIPDPEKRKEFLAKAREEFARLMQAETQVTVVSDENSHQETVVDENGLEITRRILNNPSE